MLRIETPRHPVDGILADLGTLVRRGRRGTLVEAEYVAITGRIHADVAALGADADGMIGARLSLLDRLREAEVLTEQVFDEITALIRVSLCRFRDADLPTVPNFAVLPSGIHGRRIGFLTVVEGGASNHPDTPLKGA